MTLPTILWVEPFIDIGTWPAMYYSTNWGGSVGGWGNPGANLQANLQWGRGTGASQGWVMRGNSGGSFVVPLVSLGITPASTMGYCIAFNRGGNASSSTVIGEFGEVDGTTGLNVLHIGIYINSAGRVVVKRGSTQIGLSDGPGGSAGTGTVAFTAPLGDGGSSSPPYAHYEAKLVISATVGVVQIWADQVLIINLSSANTKNGSSGVIGLMGAGVLAGQTATDFIIHDGSNRLGDVRGAYFETVADGSYTAGTAVGVATKHGAVDEFPQSNSDTDYVEFDDTSLPKAASFTLRALPSNVISVIAVIPRTIARKDDAGTSTCRPLLVSGGTTDDGGVTLSVPNGYTVYQSKVYMLDPNGSIAWTVANANAIEIGHRRIA